MPTPEPWFFTYNAWSYSKHRLYDLCKRSYYYRYIAPALRESKDVDIYKLKRLKDLNSKYALEGLLIHGVIENQIGEHYAGRDLNEDSAKAQFVRRVEQYRMMARETLTEFYNGLPDDDAFFDRIRDGGQDKIRMFFGIIWPQVRDLEYLKHEDYDKFRIHDVDVSVKVDYAGRTEEDVIVITDWKTGADNEEYESDLQIGTYVLWAMGYYERDPAQIRSLLAYLKTGIIRRYEFSFDDLEKIKIIILDDFEKMNASYEMGDFPASPAPKKCISCQFWMVCQESGMKDILPPVPVS